MNIEIHQTSIHRSIYLSSTIGGAIFAAADDDDDDDDDDVLVLLHLVEDRANISA